VCKALGGAECGDVGGWCLCGWGWIVVFMVLKGFFVLCGRGGVGPFSCGIVVVDRMVWL